MTAEYTDEEVYLRVKVTIPWTTENAKKCIDETKAEAIKRGRTCILFDLSYWTQPDNELTRFWSGEHLAKVLQAPFKIAAFGAPNAINKFAENTAVNRGALFRVFPDEQAAIQWLMG